MKQKETTYDIIQRQRVDWGVGNYATKTFKDKSKYNRKQKHKKDYRREDY